jgi:hypothetical protein
MKKAFLLFISILFFSSAFSQVKFGLNFNPGIAINRVSEPVDTLSYNPKGAGLKFTAGPDIHFLFGDNAGVSIGIWYAAKRAGVTITDKLSGTKRQDVYNLQYVQLPLVLQLFTNEIATDMKIYFRVGSTFDIKLASKEKKIDANHIDPVTQATDPIITKFGRFDANILAGAGIRLQMGDNTYLTGGLRYTRGLINNASKYDSGIKEFKLNTDMLSLDIGITF